MIKKCLVLITMSVVMVATVGCAKPDGGFAPSITSDVIVPPAADTSSESNFKYGSEVLTASGWIINIDQADPIESQLIANGWEVEIKYE